MSSGTVWAIMVVIGAGTFALRLSFIELVDRLRFPETMKHALRFVPPAVLAALVIPAILLGGPEGGELANPRLFAGLVAGLVAWYTRNVVWTLCSGMGVIWILAWLGVGS